MRAFEVEEPGRAVVTPRPMRRHLLLAICAFLTACGGAAATETETPSDEPEVSASTSGSEEAQLAWADMSQEQRGEYMANVVVPRLRPVFQQFDAEEFAEFNCATCHGDNAQEVGFRMPNGLHPLNPTQIPSMFESEDPEVQRVAQFMAGEVTPLMTELLGAAPYDPETHQGFGCMSCHSAQE